MRRDQDKERMTFEKSGDVPRETTMPGIYRPKKSNVQRNKTYQKLHLLAVERIMDFNHVMQMFRNQQNHYCVSYQIKNCR